MNETTSESPDTYPDEATVAALKAKYPTRELRIAYHRTLNLHAVIKVPTRGEWRIFRGLQADKDKRVEASEMLVAACIVWPEKDELTKQLDAHPALLETWAGEVVEAAGVTADVSQKKL